MRKFVIRQKMSGTGSIHDLSNEWFDRVIKLRKNCNYFIVFADYYGRGSLYFVNEDRLIKEYKRLNELGYSFKVFNADGQVLIFDGLQFVKDWEYPPLEEI